MAELKNKFTWSKSRGDVFRLCKRKYYYQYYGSWGGWEPLADAGVREAYVLKQLKNRFLWAGEAVHHDVAHVLRRLSLGELISLERSLTRARTRMRQQFLDSRAKLYRQKPKEITGLCEHEYDQPVDSKTWKETWQRVETCLRRFYGGDLFGKLKKLGPGAWKTIEHRMSFSLADIVVFMKIDLAFEENGVLTIVDWKTGKSPDSEDGFFQLGCYALFAQDSWGFSPADIRIIESNLYHGRQVVHMINADRLNEVAGRIRDEARLMKEALVDPFENKAKLDSFSMTDNKALCRGCNFQRLCYPRGLSFAMETDKEMIHAI